MRVSEEVCMKVKEEQLVINEIMKGKRMNTLVTCLLRKARVNFCYQGESIEEQLLGFVEQGGRGSSLSAQ